MRVNAMTDPSKGRSRCKQAVVDELLRDGRLMRLDMKGKYIMSESYSGQVTLNNICGIFYAKQGLRLPLDPLS